MAKCLRQWLLRRKYEYLRRPMRDAAVCQDGALLELKRLETRYPPSLRGYGGTGLVSYKIKIATFGE
jgi:hypothetical protein